MQLTQQRSFSLTSLLQQQQQQQQQQPSVLHETISSELPQQPQGQQQQKNSVADDDASDPFAENRAKKAAKRDRFLGRERQKQQLEQLRALVSEPISKSLSSAGADASKTGASDAGLGGGWGVKVTGASFFCKAADEAAAQWQVKIVTWHAACGSQFTAVCQAQKDVVRGIIKRKIKSSKWGGKGSR